MEINRELQKALQQALEESCHRDNGCSVQEYLYRGRRSTPTRRWFLAPHLDPQRRDDPLANRAYAEDTDD